MEKFVIQSDNNGVKEVERFLGSFCDDNHIANYLATISVPVLHAVRNAIEHGNRGDVSKKVSLECGYQPKGIFFVVEDEGDGFDYVRYGACPADGDRGQGIFLIATLSDRYQFFNGGKSVRIEFDIQGIEASDALERMAVLNAFFVSQNVAVG